MEENIKLTKLASCGGCGAKVGGKQKSVNTTSSKPRSRSSDAMAIRWERVPFFTGSSQ